MTFNIEVIIFHFQILFKFKDRKSTRLNSSHLGISYAVFCLKKKKNKSELQSLRHLVCVLLLQKKTTTTLMLIDRTLDPADHSIRSDSHSRWRNTNTRLRADA